MTGNKHSTAAGWTDPDDAPDLSTPEYQAKLAAAPVRRGRPKSASPKVRVGFRLSGDLVERIRASGPGYNALVEKMLREGFEGEKALIIGPKAKASVPPRPTQKKAAKSGNKRRA